MSDKVASYYAEMGFKVNRAQFQQAEAQMEKLRLLMLKLKTEFDKSFKFSPKVQFNSLNFQREIQKSMNQISRLVQFKVDRFQVDGSRLTSSLESAIRRAQHSVGSIKLKGIVERSSVSQSARSVVKQHEAGLAANGFQGGVGGLIAASRAGVAGVAGYTGYAGIQQLNDHIDNVENRVITTDQARMLLGQAVGGSDVRKTNALEYFKETTNKYGTNAEGGVRDFNSLLINQRMQGTSTRDALGNWRLIQERLAVAHLGTEQQQRLIRQLVQINSKGKVTQEDMSTIADSDSGLKPLLIQSVAKSRGLTGDVGAQYAKLQEKGLITWNDMIDALKLSSKQYARELEESSNSLRAERARTENTQFWSNMDRNSAELVDTLKARNEAEQKLLESTLPLQKLFTQLVEIPVIERVTSFTNGLADFAKWADAIRTGAKTSEQAIEDVKKNAPDVAKGYLDLHPGVKGISWLWENHPILKRVKDGAGSLYDQIMGPEWGTPGNRFTPDFQRYREMQNKYLQPINDFQMPNMINNPNIEPIRAPQFGQNPVVNTPDTQQMMQSLQQSYTSNSNNTTDARVYIEPGAIVINGTDLSVQDISRELESQMKSIAERVQYNTISETIVNYPSIGR